MHDDARVRSAAPPPTAARKAALAGMLAVLVVGCTTATLPPPAPPAPPPPVAPTLTAAERDQLMKESAPYRKAGTATIAGQVTLDTTRGRVVAGEGTRVVLTPATAFARAQYQRYAVELDQEPPRVGEQIAWTATTDAEGRFSFGSLPPGDYLLTSPVGWRELGPATVMRTDVAVATVTVAAGGTAQVSVTRSVKYQLDV
jgi:hypothetical protein